MMNDKLGCFVHLPLPMQSIGKGRMNFVITRICVPVEGSVLVETLSLSCLEYLLGEPLTYP